jgi:hypothetical protein
VLDINAISTFAKTKVMQDRACIQCRKIKGLECSGMMMTVFLKKVFRKFFPHLKNIFRIFLLLVKCSRDFFPAVNSFSFCADWCITRSNEEEIMADHHPG